MARRNAVRIKIDGIQDVQQRLATVGLTLRSPAVTREIQRGAEVMAGRARARAPQDIGKLRRGIYTASSESYRFPQLSRNGQRINSPLERLVNKRSVLREARELAKQKAQGKKR